MRLFTLAVALACYGVLLFGLTLAPLSRVPVTEENRLHLVPLETTIMFLKLGGWAMIVNVAGNLLAFIPLGFLWPLLREGRTRAWRVGALAAAVSLLIETLQYLSGRRYADVDDLILNTVGGLIGYGVYWAFDRVATTVLSTHRGLVFAAESRGGKR